VNEAVANIPWLPLPEAAARVARHRGCTPEAAELLIVDAGKNDRIKARGVIESQSVALRIVGEGKSGQIKAPAAIEGWPVSPLPAAWNGTIDFAAATMKPRGVSYRITNVELCFIDLIAAGLLPAPAEKARWLAQEAIAYLVKDVPLPWGAWQGAGAAPAKIGQAEIDLAEMIRAGVPAWGRPAPFAPERPIPADDFHVDMIEAKAPRLGQPKVVVRIDGAVGTSPPQRSADYKGPPWSSIEVDSAALRQARLRLVEPEPAPAMESSRAEPVPLPEPAPAEGMGDQAGAANPSQPPQAPRQSQQPTNERELSSADAQPQPQSPNSPVAEVPKLSGKEWVPEAYARRPNELLAMGITGASKVLAEESKNAADCAKPLTARYIEKLLRGLGTFPKAPRGLLNQRPK
jgi:hypothetical protein